MNIKKLLCDSLVLSLSTYMDCVYGPYLTEFNKYRIQKIQHSCVRFICNVKRRDHVTPFLRDISWLRMGERRFLHLSCLVYKVVVTGAPVYLREILVRRSDIHAVNLRYLFTQFTIPKHRTQFFKNCFAYQAVHTLNRLHFCTDMPTHQFKRMTKNYILENQVSL